ncbi:unnamed protein product [Cuscuta campestris]|uniref:50S ribosomal protein L35 n=1 Tax=Cuscuta campestris TaxID=132261 RepID=A0A484N2W5_9ASTE|nr:unnamed protein product [Cuscuta campestris]
MASSLISASHCPPAFYFCSRTQPLIPSRVSAVPSPFTGKTPTLNLSSSSAISSLAPVIIPRFPSPLQKTPRWLILVCAKGYKMKTHKASAKRFRVSGSGKIMRRRAGKQHLLRKKNARRRLRLSKMVQVDRSDYNNVIGALPYLKVNRAN